MASDYEKQWPALRLTWAAEKIAEWRSDLEKPDLPLLTRRKLEGDIANMQMALKHWEREAKGA